MTFKFLVGAITALCVTESVHSFGNADQTFRRRSFLTRQSLMSLNLNPRIAKMIDGEYWRESHLKEWEQERHEHDEAVLEHDLPTQFDTSDDDFLEPTFHIQEKKDRKMAREHPQKYCADRCLATGYCDAFEDFFNFSPEEVIGFCTDCVLSEDEEPCDIPYEAMDQLLQKESDEFNGNLRP